MIAAKLFVVLAGVCVAQASVPAYSFQTVHHHGHHGGLNGGLNGGIGGAGLGGVGIGGAGIGIGGAGLGAGLGAGIGGGLGGGLGGFGGLGGLGAGVGLGGIGLGNGLGGGVGINGGLGGAGIGSGVYGGAYGHHDQHHEHHSHPQYKFDYGVKDAHTGDHKEQWETRDGDLVKGAYSLAEADGTHRVVEYTSDKHNGFNAIVKRVGHAQHPHHGHSYTNVNQIHHSSGY